MLPILEKMTPNEIEELKEKVRTQLPGLRARDDLRAAGWYHNFFCDDGTRLEFDLDKPEEHACLTCGKVYNDELKNRAWLTGFRNARQALLVQASALAREDESFRELVKDELEWLADNYLKMEVVKSSDGSGIEARFMGTALSESVAGCTYAHCIAAAGEYLPANLADRLKTDYLKPMHDLQIQYIQKPRITKRTGKRQLPHNIWVWHGSAVASAALVLEDEAKLAFALQAPSGLDFQMQAGPQEDGLWLEGSTGYHYYALRALTWLFGTARLMKQELPTLKPGFLKMARAPRPIYFSNGNGPVYADSWAPQSIKSPMIYKYAAPLLDDDEVNAFLQEIEQGTASFRKGSRDIPGFRLAMAGWGPWELAVKYGHLHRSHAHPDVGSLMVLLNGEEVISDLGTTGYGAELIHWNRSPHAHNTVAVDGIFDSDEYLNPGLTPGQVKCEANRIFIEGTIAGDCQLTRELVFREDGAIEDTVTVSCDRPRQWTWWLHTNAAFTDLDGEADSEYFKDIPFIADCQLVKPDQVFDNGQISIELLNREEDPVRTIVSPGNLVVDQRYGIVWEKEGREATFRIVLREGK